MKFRHAAALALVGWYVIAAPRVQEPNGNWTLNENAPLSQWEKSPYSFDCKIDCERVRDWSIDFYKGHIGTVTEAKTKEELGRAQILSGQCIATDDPRLKGN